MPILDIVLQQATEAQKKQQTLITLGATQALAESMRSVIESYELPLRQMGEIMVAYTTPLKMLQEAFDSQAKAILQMQEAINAAPIVQLAAMLQEVGETHKRMAAAISAASNLNVAKLVNFNLGYPFVQEGEIIEDKTQRVTQNTHKEQALVVPQPRAIVLVTPSWQSKRSILGLKEIAGKSFQYKRRTLSKLSHRNSEGRLLSLILGSRDLFVNDGDIYQTLKIPDKRSFSWILRNLKRKFRLNGLLVNIERRWNPDGYILIDIQYLQ